MVVGGVICHNPCTLHTYTIETDTCMHATIRCIGCMSIYARAIVTSLQLRDVIILASPDVPLSKRQQVPPDTVLAVMGRKHGEIMM